MLNINVSLTRDSHMAMPGIVMRGDSQCHNYQGCFVTGDPQNSTFHNTKIVYKKVVCQNYISELQRYNKKIDEIKKFWGKIENRG